MICEKYQISQCLVPREDQESFVRGGRRAFIGPPAKRHLNGVSLACQWGPNIEYWLGSFVIFRRSGPVLLRNPICLWLFRGDWGPDSLPPPPLDPRMVPGSIPFDILLTTISVVNGFFLLYVFRLCSVSTVAHVISTTWWHKRQDVASTYLDIGQYTGFRYLSHQWAAKVQASLRIFGGLPEPSLLAYTKYG